MQLDCATPATSHDGHPKAERGNDSSVFTAIYQDDVNIAVWQREQQTILNQYAEEWAQHYPTHSPRLLVPTSLMSTSKVAQQIEQALPNLGHKQAFQQDILLLIDMFACLFDAEEVGLRLTPLTKAMCPRFHVDNIPCRLVSTYAGLGTEWLLEENLNRSRLGKGANGLPDHKSGIFKDPDTVQQLSCQHVALLKGSGWIGNEDHGLVHRSPALPPKQSRLLLTLDFA